MMVDNTVGNLPENISKDDIRKLFAKISAVVDVHIPAQSVTGIQRGFCIVVIDANSVSISKCISTYDKCFWKGSKISVEIAKNPYFKSKLEREKVDVLSAGDNNDLDPSCEMQVKPLSSQVLLLRRRRDCRIQVSVIPNKSTSVKQSDLVCGHLIRFDELGLPIGKVSSESRDRKADPNLSDLRGGGRRQGFGTLMTPSSSAAPSQMATTGACAQNSSLDSAHGGEDRLTKNQLQILQDTYREELLPRQDTTTTTSLFDPEGDPGLSGQHGLAGSEESIIAERKRQLTMLQTIMASSKTADSNSIDSISAPVILDFTKSTSLPDKAVKSGSRKASSSQLDLFSVKTEETFADLNTFKGLFGREGGVQWSGGTETANSNQLKDGDMREVLTGQGVDRLFLEAEKLGIDTRIRQGDSLAEANADTKMSFQFFGACEDHDQARRGAGIGLDKPDKGSSVVVGRNDEISPTTLHHSGSGRGDQSLHQAVSLSLDKGSARLPTFAEVLISAKLFHRVRSVDEVCKSWESERDKLTVDYKRKRKEGIKKSSARSSQLGSQENGKRKLPAAADKSGLRDKKRFRKKNQTKSNTST